MPSSMASSHPPVAVVPSCPLAPRLGGERARVRGSSLLRRSPHPAEPGRGDMKRDQLSSRWMYSNV